MQTQKVFITPEIATHYLSGNKSNRTVSNSTVTKYASDMSSGNWRLTHQGILIGKNNVVVDGQHRLHAVKKSGMGQWFLLSTDETVCSPKEMPIDIGYKRSNDFILGIHPMLSACSSHALQMGKGLANISPAQLKPVAEKLSPYFETLVNGKYTNRKTISSAPVQLGAIVRLALGDDSDYIVTTYQDLLHSNFTSLHPYPASFFRQCCVDRIAFSSRPTFARSVRVFDPSKKSISKLQVKDESFAFEEARELLLLVIGD